MLGTEITEFEFAVYVCRGPSGSGRRTRRFFVASLTRTSSSITHRHRVIVHYSLIRLMRSSNCGLRRRPHASPKRSEYIHTGTKMYKAYTYARAYAYSLWLSLSIFFHGRYFPFTRERMQTRGKRE